MPRTIAAHHRNNVVEALPNPGVWSAPAPVMNPARALIAPTPTTRCLVMGIVNVTPDSLSDGGVADTPSAAIRRGVLLASYGADIVDVGGESTRPNAQRVSVAEEMSRVIPVIAALASEGITVSVDTMRADVARAAVHVGAAIVNDVSCGLADLEMAPAVAGLGVPYVATHWRGTQPNDEHACGVRRRSCRGGHRTRTPRGGARRGWDIRATTGTGPRLGICQNR